MKIKIKKSSWIKTDNSYWSKFNFLKTRRKMYLKIMGLVLLSICIWAKRIKLQKYVKKIK